MSLFKPKEPKQLLQELLDRARQLPPATTEEQHERAMSFAYGNLAMTTKHKPSRAAFEKLAAYRYGWSAEKFKAWADQRNGWLESTNAPRNGPYR